MSTGFHGKVIGAVAAAALTLVGVGTGPTHAGEYDTERALAAILGIAVLGAIIADKHDDDHKSTRGPTHRVDPRPLPPRARHENRHKPRGPYVAPRRAALPRSCLLEMDTRRGGSTQVYGGRCLRSSYRDTHRLPEACQREVRGGRHAREVWSARCLARRGYRTPGRH